MKVRLHPKRFIGGDGLHTTVVFVIGAFFGYFVLTSVVRDFQGFADGLSLFDDHAKVEELRFDLDFRGLRELSYNLEVLYEAGEAGLARRGEFKKSVSANLVHQDKDYRARIRLKGDKADHLGLFDGKLSYMVELRDGATLFGMKKFALQHPGTRSYLDGWLFHRWLQYEGVINLRTYFVRLFINGKDLGIYNLEEHFEKRLLEHNRRREGPIVRFDEEVLWNPDMYFHNNVEDEERFTRTRAIGFDANNTLANLPEDQLGRAFSMLNGFMEGKYTTNEVFDVDLLARYLAVVTATDGYHALRWINLRFYLNPITSKLEPIGFDADPGGEVTYLAHELKYNTIHDRPLYERIFDDRALLKAYVRHLDRMSSESYFSEFAATFEPDARALEKVLQTEFTNYAFSLQNYHTNIRRIRTMIRPHTAIDSFLYEDSGSDITIMAGNTQTLPVEVLSLHSVDGDTFEPDRPYLLGPKKRYGTVEYVPVRFSKPEGFVFPDVMPKRVTIRYRALGSRSIQEYEVSPWPFPRSDFLEGDQIIGLESNVEEFEFLVRSDKEITIKKGTWNLDKPLIVPPGKILKGGPGTILDLENDAFVLSYSPVELRGTEDNPIRIVSRDKSGQGVLIVNAGGRSFIDYVMFEGLSAPQRRGWQLTGAVTFYQSPVSIDHSHFADNVNSDDALNLIRSEFSLSHLSFSDIEADAIDVDFSDGDIISASFDTTGNDAIDVSGSEVRITSVSMTSIGDKGVSAGERSNVTVSDLTFDVGKIGIASKDLSTVQVTGMHMTNAEYPLAAYQKKSEFGSGYLKLTSPLAFEGEIIKDEKSRIIIDDRTYPVVTADVFARLGLNE